MALEGANAAMEAAFAFVCKDRKDSFKMDSVEGKVWEDGHAEANEVAPPVRSLRADAKRRANEHKERMRQDRQDENRPPNANADRQQAMKMASKPRLKAVAERSPRLSEMAQARFPRVTSMQLSPQRPAPGNQGACRSPRSSNAMQAGRRSPRSKDVAQTPGQQSVHGERPRGGTSPRQGRIPLQALPEGVDKFTAPDWPPFDSSVVYQPKSSVGSFAPPPGSPRLQSRQMSRCASADVHTMASSMKTPRASTSSFASNASLSKLVNASFASDAELLRSRYMQSVTSPKRGPNRAPSQDVVRSPRRAPSQDLARSPSHDRSVCVEESHYAQMNSFAALEKYAQKNSLSALEQYAQRTSLNKNHSSSSSTHNLSTSRGSLQAKKTRSRSASLFWVPPPEAAVLCDSMKSPSFLLNCRGQGEAQGGREFTTESDLGVNLPPPQTVVGSSSPRAVMSVVQSAVCALLPPSPSLGHRDTKPGATSFSYVPSRRASHAVPSQR